MSSTDITETLVAPLSTVIQRVARAVADAQTALDKESLTAFETLKDKHPELHAIGYQPTFYSIPETSVEMKMTVHYDEEQSGEQKKRLLLAPYNARSKYEVSGSSTLKFRIVPVPSPVTDANTPKNKNNG